MKKGDRVRLSELAKSAGIFRARDQERKGIFAGIEKGLYIKVLWDGNRSVGSGLHPDFVELDDTPHSNGDRA